MKPKTRRLVLVLVALAGLGGATALALSALQSSIVFFYSPTDIAQKNLPTGRTMRIGGLVVKGSIKQLTPGPAIAFRVTDLRNTLKVVYRGILPDLFREGQGVVAQGVMRPDGTFVARTVLAKHDAKYMPKEVADALKKSGHWQPGGEAEAGNATASPNNDGGSKP